MDIVNKIPTRASTSISKDKNTQSSSDKSHTLSIRMESPRKKTKTKRGRGTLIIPGCALGAEAVAFSLKTRKAKRTNKRCEVSEGIESNKRHRLVSEDHEHVVFQQIQDLGKEGNDGKVPARRFREKLTANCP